MKKIIVGLAGLIAVYGYLLFANGEHNLQTLANTQYLFTNYNSGDTGITSNRGYEVAFDTVGDVGYASFGGGLSIGVKQSGGSYKFTNYNDTADGITNNNGYGVAFDTVGDVGYASFGGGLSIGVKQSGGSYKFTNYNDTADGITNNNGYGVAFDTVGDVGYVSDGGLSIGVKQSGGSYKFTNYNSGDTGITNNSGREVAFDTAGDVGYASFGGGLSIGVKQSGGSYKFTNDITNDVVRGVAFASNGDVGYASDGRGVSIGVKQSDDSYKFTNYNDTADGITNNGGYGVAFDTVGDVGYVSFGGGLSIGVKQSGGSYKFTNYNSTTNEIGGEQGSGIAFDTAGDVGYASFDGGLSIGTTTLNATVDGSNILYDENNNSLENFDVEGARINLNGALGAVVNNSYNTFVQISVTSSDTSDQYAFIEYITKDGTIAGGNRDDNYSSYQQYETVQAMSTNTNRYINLPNLINDDDGFAKSTTLTFSVEYGQDQDTLTNALPATGNTITTPATNIADNAKYSPGSFSPTDSNYIYNESNDTYDLKGTLLNPLEIGFESAINSFVDTTDNFYLQITVTNLLNENTNDYYQSVYYFTSNGAVPIDGIPQNKLGNIDPVIVLADGSTSINDFAVANLAPSTSYNLQISLGLNQTTRYDLLRDGFNGSISFNTPNKPSMINPGGSSSNNNGAIIGGVVGGVAGLALIGVGTAFYYHTKKKKTI